MAPGEGRLVINSFSGFFFVVNIMALSSLDC
jgi:hypothetical protein